MYGRKVSGGNTWNQQSSQEKVFSLEKVSVPSHYWVLAQKQARIKGDTQTQAWSADRSYWTYWTEMGIHNQNYLGCILHGSKCILCSMITAGPQNRWVCKEQSVHIYDMEASWVRLCLHMTELRVWLDIQEAQVEGQDRIKLVPCKSFTVILSSEENKVSSLSHTDPSNCFSILNSSLYLSLQINAVYVN